MFHNFPTGSSQFYCENKKKYRNEINANRKSKQNNQYLIMFLKTISFIMLKKISNRLSICCYSFKLTVYMNHSTESFIRSQF